MARMTVLKSGDGLIIRGRNTYAVDKTGWTKCDYHIISHAHSDHLPTRIYGRPIASRETALLAAQRGLALQAASEDACEDVELIDSGHILGSRAALIEDRILYTGDLNVRDRLFLKGFTPPKADVLIIEGTYGRADFVFDDFGTIVQRMSEYVLEMLSKGQRIMALGYALGKSQVLTNIFTWFDRLVVSDRVDRFNRVYSSLGVDLRTDYLTCSEAEKSGVLEKNSWLMIEEPRWSIRKKMAQRYGALCMGFSGWTSRGGQYGWRRLDAGFPLSDHSDFKELVEVVEQVDPEETYVFCGFADNFAKHLRSLGYDAYPLGSGRRLITDF